MNQTINRIILLLFVGIIFSCNKSNDTLTFKLVEISSSTFEGGYPAVWFNPVSGVIQPVGTNTNPAYAQTSDFKFWIEPSDPEFSYQVDEVIGTNGIKLIGSGEETFNSTQKLEQISGLLREIKETDFIISNVFYIRVEKGDCAILIEDFNQTSSVLKFKWKSL